MRERTPSEIDRLEVAARGWIGTPFCENSGVRGAGVCCHMGVAEVYFDAGWLPRMDLPKGPPGHSRAKSESLMEPWLDDSEQGRLFFAPVTAIWPGDLLGFRIGRCVHHLAIALRAGSIFHVVEVIGATIGPTIPASWHKRLQRVWRPRP